MKKPIGLLGGTFDPVHFGHLRTALELRQALRLAEVRLIPCFQPVHRAVPAASPEDRLAMLRAAIGNLTELCIDEREIRRAEPSWAIDTLESLHQEFPGTPLCLIIGFDVLATLPTWRRYQDLLRFAHLVIAHRPHYHLPDSPEISRMLLDHRTDSIDELHTKAAGCILFHPVTQLEISATDIRRQFETRENPRYLLPDAVCDYIYKHGIYQTHDGNSHEH